MPSPRTMQHAHAGDPRRARLPRARRQGLAYYNTLKARGVDARLLWFPDENHWVLKPRNSRLWYEEFFAWLQQPRHGRARKRS